MPVTVLNQTDNEMDLKISHGDVTALRKVMKKWKFLDAASAIRFAIATLYLTKKGTLYKKEENGSYSLLIPKTCA